MADLNEGRHDLPRSPRRFVAFAVIAVLLFGLLGGRLFQLQVVDGSTYAHRAAAARTVELPVRAPRGLIFDREARRLVVNTPAWTVKVRPADLPEVGRDTLLARVAALTGNDAATLIGRLDAFVGSPYDLVPVARGISREVALLIGEQAEALPGVVIEVDAVRRYLDESGEPDGELLAHVLGYTAAISRNELESRPGEGYLPDDTIGKSGVEASFEPVLRGSYGTELWERDASGRPVKVVSRLAEPVPGTNLMLTIDAAMQRQATEALAWGMEVAGVSQGVTIVMNPQTGEILAMVSMPTYDSNRFATGISAADFQAYLTDPDRPLRNHAISDIYPPGSTYKLVTAVAALEEGVTTPEQRWETFACFQIPGAPEGECLFDWNRAGFGLLDIVGAFARSSDTFFYQMAIALGIDGMAEWAYQYGFGERTGIRLPNEARGIIASTRWAQGQGRAGVYTGEVAQAGIGQNVIAVTPLQVLNAYAALANGGRLMEPMIVRGETDASGNLVNEYQPRVVGEVAASDHHQRLLRIAAREVITSGHAYNIRDLQLPGALSGKTGTAEFGEPLPETGNLPFHSWFVAYLPSSEGATDAELAVVTFTHSATVRGNVSLEVVKYFLQRHFELDVDLRLDPNDVSLVSAN